MDTFAEELELSLQNCRLLVVSLFLPQTIAQNKPCLSRQPSTKRLERLARQQAANLEKNFANYHVGPSTLGNIGLQNAVNSLKDQIRSKVWIGSLGTSTESYSDDFKSAITQKLTTEYESMPVFLSDEEVEGHYNQFCKQVLWKPFHYQLPDYPKGQAYEELSWRQYVSVNRKFAETIAEVYRPGDVVWINDYHLMLVPSMLRKLVPQAIIGFFLHIPFPSSEIFRCLHVRKHILEGMLGADLIGFQTHSFMRHFLNTCTRLLAVETKPGSVLLDNSIATTGIFPIGINLLALNEKRNNPEVSELIASLKEKYAGKKILIGRDKNDHVKGLRQKMLAYEKFLQLHPEWHGKVVLIQVALPTTEENENETHVSDVVTRINANFGSLEFSPVVYLPQDISFSHYVALLSIADGCLITSLRDGMNLTSHEYVACQEEKHSPLIISEFAGTYGSFGAALRVNPWDAHEVASAIHETLVMTEEDKLNRWKELYSYIATHSAQNYVESFVNELIRSFNENQNNIPSHIPVLTSDTIKEFHDDSEYRLFLLDYDGTLVNERDVFLPSSRGVQAAVRLAEDPKSIVYIISGRPKTELLRAFASYPQIGLSAENGSYLKHAGQSEWQSFVDERDLSWHHDVTEIFQYYTARTPGSFIEPGDVRIVWNYSFADQNFGAWQAAECASHIQQSLAGRYSLQTVPKKRSVQVMPQSTNKGGLVVRLLKHYQKKFLRKEIAHPIDFVLCVGDDRTDETMFERLNLIHTGGGGTYSDVPMSPISPALSQLSEINLNAGSPEHEAIESDRHSITTFRSSDDAVYGGGHHATDASAAAPRAIFTCTVGSKSSAAKWLIPNIEEVLRVLDELQK
ncbi:glycosyltransferase family 20-domain-containing protein [Polychytrium aggregatum]|uniref:glycosyltransferase family 20-domain-containing protein n=1 Tax=Polychytrium aggregatum TaxID=110093 RepID=UPI0022FE7C84|nr:glycosyltransferase family 20-domain-containing protein [Polychytrium aggregatum]KAI9197114.1 glycosyltransferase family 20-domain-containing protein [Polychytrium aggregatum]